jgi:hypothetical protein
MRERATVAFYHPAFASDKKPADSGYIYSLFFTPLFRPCKPSSGAMRFHCTQTVQPVITFLHV